MLQYSNKGKEKLHQVTQQTGQGQQHKRTEF